MNISLLGIKKAKKDETSKSFGLLSNNNKKNHNVFGEDSSSSSSEEEESNHGKNRNSKVNREIKREQEALRKRAAAAAVEYDFDGETLDDSTQAAATATTKSTDDKTNKKNDSKKESRYIMEMMKTAKKRNFERDIAYERKVAKEQEGDDNEFGEKEKFITSAYKKKLQERELWKEEQEQERRIEEEQDVTKRKDGIAGFYSNFHKNVAVGGEKQEDEQPSFFDGFETGNREETDEKIDEGKPSFLNGFAASTNEDERPYDKTHEKETLLNQDDNSATAKKSMREIRQEKASAARQRYFERRGITEQQALQESYQ